jgi:hypothetical protein
MARLQLIAEQIRAIERARREASAVSRSQSGAPRCVHPLGAGRGRQVAQLDLVPMALDPGRDSDGLALLGPGQRLLWGQTPAPQGELHRRQAEPLGEAPLDQLAHGPAGPQGERQLQLRNLPYSSYS